MSSEYSEGGVTAPAPERRPGRGAEGGPPITGVLTIVLAVIAVVLGFLILRSITSDNGGGTVGPVGPGTTDAPVVTDPPATTAAPATTTTTAPPLVFDGASVVVANANGVNGSAGMMTRALEAAGFTMGEATNAAAAVGQLEATVIYYDPSVPAAQAVAESVNQVLGADASVSPLPDTPPTQAGTLAGDVLLMLGNDKAGKSLEELAPAGDGDVVPSPGVAGDEDLSDPEVDPDEDPDA